MQWMFSGLIQVLSVQESSLRVVQICVTFEIRAEMCTRLRENVIELNNITWKCNWAHLSTFSLFLDWLCNHMIVYVAVLDVWISDTIRVFYFPILFLNFICIFLGFFSPNVYVRWIFNWTRFSYLIIKSWIIWWKQKQKYLTSDMISASMTKHQILSKISQMFVHKLQPIKLLLHECKETNQDSITNTI